MRAEGDRQGLPRQPHVAILRALLVLLAAPSAAALELTAAVGRGEDGVQSTAIGVSANLPRVPIRAGLRHYDGGGNSSDDRDQTEIFFDWQALESLSLRPSARRTRDDTFRIEERRVQLTLALDRFWDGALPTELTARYGWLDYRFRPDVRVPPVLRTVQPRPEMVGLGIAQGLGDRVLLHADYDEYRYPRGNPRLLAAFLIGSSAGEPEPINAAFTVAAFPKQQFHAGADWLIDERWSLGVGYTQLESVTGRRYRGGQLGLTRELGRRTWAGLSLERIESKPPAGESFAQAFVPPASSWFFELRAGVNL